MKRLLFALLFCSSLAQAATFSWDAVPGATGYRAYCGSATGVYGSAPIFDHTGQPAMTSRLVPLGLGTYFCVLRAYAGTGPESANSNEATVTINTPGAPTNFKIVATVAWNADLNKFVATLEPVGIDIMVKEPSVVPVQ